MEKCHAHLNMNADTGAVLRVTVKKYHDCDARIRTIVNDYCNRNFIDNLCRIAHNFEMDP